MLAGGPALAQDKLRIGKSVPNSWAFAATDVGVQAGIFKQEGIDLAISSFKGDAQMQAGLTAGAVDVALGSGPGLGFRAKGVPAIGVAAMYGAPSNLAVVVLAKSPVKTVADLKGKRIGVTTGGSLTDWLSRELARQQGWGRDGMQVMPLGSMQARLAAMERGDLDAMVVESASGFELEELKRGRIVLDFGDIEKNFYTHVIFATDAHGREAHRRAAAVPARLVQDHRVHPRQQGRDREDHRQGDRRARKHRVDASTMRRSTASRATAPGTRRRSK